MGAEIAETGSAGALSVSEPEPPSLENWEPALMAAGAVEGRAGASRAARAGRSVVTSAHFNESAWAAMLEGPIQLQRLVRKYLDDGRQMEALVVAKKGAKEFSSFVVDFQLLVAEVYVARGNRLQARELLEGERRLHPDDRRIYQALASLDD